MEERVQKNKTYEELFICCSCAVLIGFLVSLAEVIFGKGLEFILHIRAQCALLLMIGLPFAGLFIVFLFDHWGKISRKGMNLVFEVDQGVSDWIPLRLVPFMIISTWLTHLFGGSAGREGVAVQIGATISHCIGRHIHYPNTSTIFLVVGIAAGFAGLFGTPIAAVFFAMEVLVAGTLKYRAMGPALVASFTAASVSSWFGLTRASYVIHFDFNLDLHLGICLILMGIVFGVIGGLFAHFLLSVKAIVQKKIENPYIRIFGLGVILAICMALFGQGRYSNLGGNLIQSCMIDGNVYMYDWILKFVLTIFTLSIGFQGGEVTPLFSIGACLGFVLAPLFGLPPVICAALGYAAVFGSGTNTFLAPIAIGMEIFGYEYFPLFFIVCAVAYLTNRNQSIYALQQRAG